VVGNPVLLTLVYTGMKVLMSMFFAVIHHSLQSLWASGAFDVCAARQARSQERPVWTCTVTCWWQLSRVDCF